MARTEKLRRKDLREPDEFITLSRQAVTFAQENRTALLAGVGALALVVVAVIAYQMISASRQARAGVAYHAAHRLLADRKYPEAAAAFQELASSYGSTTYGALAELQAGNALLSAGRGPEAVTAYQRFLESGPATDYLRQTAQTGLAYAQEQDGHFADAKTNFAGAATVTGPLTEDALLGAARTAEAAGDQSGAKGFYEQVLQKYPTSDSRALVTDRLVRLGWTPPAKGQEESASPAAPDAGRAGE